MSIHTIKLKKEKSCGDYEYVMPHAPETVLANGNRAIPQHYLQYKHTKASIQQVVCDIDCFPLMPIFADEDENGLYIQVGMIGRENYDRSNTLRPHKIVYGRKWRIEQNIPTSEIIQTVFLAIKKAREHEIRELLTIKDICTGKVSAAFSCHHDLPLMARNKDLIVEQDQGEVFDTQAIFDLISIIKFEQRSIYIDDVLIRKKNIIVDVRLGEAPLARKQENDLAEFDNYEFSVIIDDFNPSHFLYALMDAFLLYSDRIINELFTYKGFARFSANNHPGKIAALSVASRPYSRDMKNNAFASAFEASNYETDASRVPSIGYGSLADKNCEIISQVKSLEGHLPKGFKQNTVKCQKT